VDNTPRAKRKTKPKKKKKELYRKAKKDRKKAQEKSRIQKRKRMLKKLGGEKGQTWQWSFDCLEVARGELGHHKRCKRKGFKVKSRKNKEKRGGKRGHSQDFS